MNKSELVEKLAEKARLPKKKAEEAVNLVFQGMSKALTDGDRIEIRGFGSFVNRSYHSYAGRNPRTGEAISVKPKKLPFFKVGKELKAKVDVISSTSNPELRPESTPTSQVNSGV